MWPLLGLLVVLANTSQIVDASRLERNGFGGVCGLLFFLAIGWYPISRSTIIASGKDITALSQGLWQTDSTQKEKMEAELLKRYPLWPTYRQTNEAYYLRKRTRAIAWSGSNIMITYSSLALELRITIAYGACFAKILKDASFRFGYGGTLLASLGRPR